MDTRIPIDILDNSDVVTKNNIDEVINDFTGATSEGNGVRGFVPAPQKGSQNGFLKGDGTWTTAGVVDQSISTSNNDYPILLGPTADASTSQGNKSAIFASNVKVNPSTGEVTATSFNGAVTGNITGDVTGNADTATSLASNFTIELTGDVSGSTTTNGTGTASITATVADDSHNHIISNVDGLQDALDGKAPLQHTHAAADVTSGQFDAARIPSLDASKIATGTLSSDRIPGLDGSKITTGTIALERLPEEAQPRHSHGNISQNGTLTNASAVVITDANGAIDSSSTISTTELGYLNNVTSNIQDQLDAKAEDDEVVHNTGNESIAGVKTFSDGIAVSTVSGDGSGLTSLNASQITTGTIDIARLPSGALERCVVVESEAARYALTTDDVQKGDTVKQKNTDNSYTMYFVVDDTKLDQAAGYEVYTAGSATSVPWSGVTSKPTTISGYGITDVKIESGTITLGSNTITPLTAGSTLDATKLSGTASINTTGKATTAGTADKVSKNLVLKLKSGSTEGTDLYTYNGSGAKTLDIKQGSNVTLTAAAGSLTIAATDTTYTAGTGLSLSGTEFSLADTAVTAGSYGPSANATPAYGATFNVPYITVDAQGRITAASTKTVKIPASDQVDVKVTQTVSTDNSELPILAKASNATSTITDTSKFAAAVTVNPSTGTITATKFSGAVSGNADTATKFASSQTVKLQGDVGGEASSQAGWIIDTTLSNSGVTAGSYGPSDNATPGYGATFNVPYITVDAKGRVTAASTKTVKIPASDDTNNKVTQTVSTDNSELPLLAKASNATSTVTDTSKFAAAVKLNPSTGTITATKFKGPLNGNADTATKQLSKATDGNYQDVVNVTDGTSNNYRVGTIRVTNNAGSNSILIGVHNESNAAPGGLTITSTDGVLTANFGGTATITKVVGALQGNADTSTQAKGVFLVIPNETAQTATLTATVEGITEYFPGLTIALRMPFATAASSTLNINSLGAKPIYYNNNTTNAGYYPANSVVFLVYETTTASGGCWKMVYSRDSDTHWTSHLYAGASGATANAATSNGETHLSICDNSTSRNSVKITGSGATTVSSDANGVITISSTDNNTTYTAGTGLSLSSNKFSMSNSGVTAGTYNTVTVDATGRATAGSNVSYCMHVDTLPSSVPTGLVDGGILIVG